MNSSNISLENISNLYGSNFSKYGKDSKTLGWKSRDEQVLRFLKLTQSVDLEIPATISDYGCGFADLASYLVKKNPKFIKEYIGYEINSDIANIASETIKNLGVRGRIKKQDRIEKKTDWIVVSGTFNVKSVHSNKIWQNEVIKQIENMFMGCNFGLSFNLLSTFVDFKSEELFYGDPMFFFNFCQKNLGKTVLYHDYPLYEWTITVKH
jgi:hypothetical protein